MDSFKGAMIAPQVRTSIGVKPRIDLCKIHCDSRLFSFVLSPALQFIVWYNIKELSKKFCKKSKYTKDTFKIFVF